MGNYLGVVDFGIGGLGFYKALKDRADIPVLYFADSGGLPYGRMPRGELHDRLQRVFDFLFAEGAEQIAIACNAASAAYDDCENVFGIIPFGAGMIKNGHWSNVGLLAGRGTVQSNVYRRAIDDATIDLTQRVAQPLSEHIEAGRFDGEALHRDLKKIVSPLRHKQAILLACTHYPAISDQISQYVDDGCQLLDPAEAMAAKFATNWQSGNSTGPDRFFTSGNSDRFIAGARSAFDVSVDNVDRVRL